MSVQEIKRLERVLAVLESDRDLILKEKADLMTKRKILTDEEERLGNELEAIVRRRAEQNYTSVAQLHERDIGDKAVIRLQGQQEKVAHATKILDDQELAPVLTRLAQAEQKCGSVDLLLGRRREELKRAAEKEDERRLNDVGVLRWFRQKADNGDEVGPSGDETS